MPKIHPTAIIEENVKIGAGTSVWDNVHIRHGAEIGEECIVGEKTYIAYDVKIGNRVKINAMVYICAEVTIEDGVMISASTTFTNDRFPRATFPDLKTLRPSEPDEHTLKTLVREGATIGAGCTIGNDLEIGRWAMIGMGSVVTKSVPDFHLVLGSPARSVGAVCKCGQLFHRFSAKDAEDFEVKCITCNLEYAIRNSVVKEIISSLSKHDNETHKIVVKDPRYYQNSKGKKEISGKITKFFSKRAILFEADEEVVFDWQRGKFLLLLSHDKNQNLLKDKRFKIRGGLLSDFQLSNLDEKESETDLEGQVLYVLHGNLLVNE